MGFFDFLKTTDIDQGVARFRETAGAMLLDVRTAQEYAGGHIPGSRNLPLQELVRAPKLVPSPQTPLFVYCLSGGRSRQATAMLQRMGYQNVHNIGGISGYRGKMEG